jgi:hypothetical protein
MAQGAMMILKPAILAMAIMAVSTQLVFAQSIVFGDDSGEFPNDDICDDPRFVGIDMTTTTTVAESLLRDATDCARAYAQKTIRLARTAGESTPADCGAIDFGDDTSEWARDTECDDPRFGGQGVHSILLPEDMMRDATDCKALCDSGAIWLR